MAFFARLSKAAAHSPHGVHASACELTTNGKEYAPTDAAVSFGVWTKVREMARMWSEGASTAHDTHIDTRERSAHLRRGSATLVASQTPTGHVVPPPAPAAMMLGLAGGVNHPPHGPQHAYAWLWLPTRPSAATERM